MVRSLSDTSLSDFGYSLDTVNWKVWILKYTKWVHIRPVQCDTHNQFAGRVA